MAAKKQDYSGYKKLQAAIKNKTINNLYVFYGEERYSLENSLRLIRKMLVAPEMEEFNYKCFEGRSMTFSMLEQAVDALPVFSERTLIVVQDYNIFGEPESVRSSLLQLFSDLPEYVCLIFVYDTVEFKTYGNLKHNNAIKKLMEIVEFPPQPQSDLVNSVIRRFSKMNKRIKREDAEYFVFITDGLIHTIVSEIEKLSAYCSGEVVTRKDIDTIVTPALDAVIYKLLDAIIWQDYDKASKILSDLLRMQEQPHKILYSISVRMRQLLAAKICYQQGKDELFLMELYGIRDFQARNLMQGAKGTSLSWCRGAVRLCAETAFLLNSGGGEGKELLAELLYKMALISNAPKNVLRG